MRTGAAAGHEGCFHETGFYGSDDEYLALAVPYVKEAVAAGEPMYVTASEATAGLVRRALPSTDGVTFIPASACYTRPAAAIREYRGALARDIAAGAGQVRVLAEVPHPGLGVPWEAWRRYEAAANLVYNDYPVWGRCLYDTRSAPAEVVDDARRTHPRIATPGGEQTGNPYFVAPEVFLCDDQGRPAPAEAAAADLVLVDPSPRDARLAVAASADAISLPPDRRDDLVMAVSEAVTNALVHGTPPVALSVWSGEGRVVVTVRDRGPGPSFPLAGLVPLSDGAGGRGLWIVHQLVDEVGLHRDEGGFTLRMAASA